MSLIYNCPFFYCQLGCVQRNATTKMKISRSPLLYDGALQLLFHSHGEHCVSPCVILDRGKAIEILYLYLMDYYRYFNMVDTSLQ